MDAKYRVGDSEVYVSEGGKICIVAEEWEEPMVFEPYRIEALVAALQKAAQEAE